MITNRDIGTVIKIIRVPQDTFYLVRNSGSVDADLLLFTGKGVPISEDTIQTTQPASLFFDSSGNYYCLNTDKKIAQYNFDTKELDLLTGQTAIPWTKIFVDRLDDGTFISSRTFYDPTPGVVVLESQRYSLDGTLEESNIITINGYSGSLGALNSFSTDGVITVLTFSDDVFVGTATYSATGLIDSFTVDTTYVDETSGTLMDGKLYTLTGDELRIRDLTAEISEETPEVSDRQPDSSWENDCNYVMGSKVCVYPSTETDSIERVCTEEYDSNYNVSWVCVPPFPGVEQPPIITLSLTAVLVDSIPISGFSVGSIGVKISDIEESFRGLLKSIDSSNPTTETIANADGNPVLFTQPGIKFLEITTRENLDDYLDGKVDIVSVDEEEYEIESIVSTGNRYEITLQTPEKS